MNVNHSHYCMVDENLQLWVNCSIANRIFNIKRCGRHIKIDIFPDGIFPEILQVQYLSDHLIVLTTNNQLLRVDQQHPRGCPIHPQIAAKYIYNYRHLLVIVDLDYRLYLDDRLLSDNITSITSDRSSLIWLSDGRLCSYDGVEIKILTGYYPSSRLIGRFLIDGDNDIHQLNETNRELVKLFRVDYEIVDISAYPSKGYITIVDRDGRVRQYYNDGRFDQYSDTKNPDYQISRFLNDIEGRVNVELGDGSIITRGLLTRGIKLLRLEDYYNPRVKSALG